MKTAREILHGQRIAHHAETVWGWGTPAGRIRADRRKSYLARYGSAAPGRAILEIGCGTGMFTTALAASGAHVVAFDICWELLCQVPRAQDGSNGLHLFVGDVEHLPLPDASFDAVVGVSILHHLNLRPALAEIKRILKPVGRVVFSEPNMLNPQIFVQKHVPFIKRWLGDSPDETAFVRWPLAAELQRAGFGEVRVTPFDFLHPWTPEPIIPLVSRMGAVMESLPAVRELAGSLLITAAVAP